MYRIRFRDGETKRRCALQTADRTEADEALSHLEANLRLIERASSTLPPEGADVGVYVLTGGRHETRQSQAERPRRATLPALVNEYLARFP